LSGGKMKPKCKICKKEKQIEYEGDRVQYPVFSCPEHGIETNEWEKWWNNYSDRGLSKEYWHDKRERPSCVVSYFCNQYYEFYGFPYTLDYSNPIPYKNKEFTMARRIISMFGENYKYIPNYIKWVFKKKVKNRKYPVNSLGFFASSQFVNEYNAARERANKPKRSSSIPERFLQWCRDSYPKIVDYHELQSLNDLNMLIGIAEADPQSEEMNVIREARLKGIIPQSGFIQLEE
jgi:hypothetical protein